MLPFVSPALVSGKGKRPEAVIASLKKNKNTCIMRQIKHKFQWPVKCFISFYFF